MKLIIVLTKEVADKDAAEVLVAIVKAKLIEYPDVEVSARVSDLIETT